MSDAECWKLNRMRQLEDENLRLLNLVNDKQIQNDEKDKRIAEHRAEILEAERRGFKAARAYRQNIREVFMNDPGFAAKYKTFDDWQREVNSKEGASDE